MRTYLYQALLADTELLAMLTGDDDIFRVYQASSIDYIPERPFVTYRMHTGFPLEGGIGEREYCQIWVNDDPGDYLKIDEIMRLIRQALEAIPAQDNFLDARWIESSVDLRDTAMGTINRYIRFRFTGALRERD